MSSKYWEVISGPDNFIKLNALTGYLNNVEQFILGLGKVVSMYHKPEFQKESIM